MQAALFPLMDYHVVIYSKYELVGYDLPNLRASFTPLQRLSYYTRRLLIPHIYPLPGIKNLVNLLGKASLHSPTFDDLRTFEKLT